MGKLCELVGQLMWIKVLGDKRRPVLGRRSMRVVGRWTFVGHRPFLFRSLFLALQVDVREGVDDLDDAGGEAVAPGGNCEGIELARQDVGEAVVAEA